MTNPALTAYVVHWQAPDRCEATVKSILASADVDVRVVVIDNSLDRGAAIRAILGDSVEVIATGKNLGYAGGANCGLAHWLRTNPLDSYVAITNHDCLLDPDALRQLVEAIDADRSIGAVGPAIVDGVGHWIGGTWDGRQVGMRVVAGGIPETVDAQWLKGECIVIRREVLDDIGGFDDRFGSYVEDVDFCLRVSGAGYRCVVCTGVTSRSVGSMATADAGFSLARRRTMIRRNQVFVAAKQHGSRALVQSVADVCVSAVQTFAATALPGRTPQQRRDSLAFAKVHVGVLVDLVRHRRVLRSIIQDPQAGCQLRAEQA